MRAKINLYLQNIISMFKWKSYIILMISMIIIVTIPMACTKELTITDDLLKFSGDLKKWSTFQEIYDLVDSHSIDYHGEKVDAYLLKSCIQILEPVVLGYDVYLLAEDGFMVKIDGETINDTYIAFIKGQGWSFISNKHPVNSGIKNMSDIIIVTNNAGMNSHNKLNKGIDPDFYGLNIISDNSNFYYTKGELLILNNKQFIVEDGVSSLEDISISVLKQKQAVEFTTLYFEEFSKLLIYTFSGEEYYDYNKNGFIEVNANQINYINEDLTQEKLDIVGVMVDPIGTNNRNNYFDVSHYLDKDMKVMTILLDGFSFEQYDFIKKYKSNLVLSNISQVKKAKTVYKPVTNAGFASILSGVEPGETGVLNRNFRELKVPTIFDYCDDNNKTHGLIEGDINILKVNTKTYLNIDKDGNGYTDNEIMETLKDVMKEDLDYTFVHFHSIDEFGHSFGPLAKETIDQIEVIDTYLNEIIKSFNGQIVITSDHGMHNESDYGDHGDFRYEDMFVPYMIISGGNDE